MATVLVAANKTANADGTRAVIVSIDGAPRYLVDHRVPASAALADVGTVIDNNISTAERAGMIAHANEVGPARIPEDWHREALDTADYPALVRAGFVETWAELDAIRAAVGMPVRTNAERIAAVRAEVNR